MAFLLGSLTGGLFGGMSDAVSIMNGWEGLKQRRLETEREQKLTDAGDAARQAIETGDGAAANTTPTTGAPAAGAGPIPLHPAPGRDASGRPDITSMPLPKFMQPTNKPAVLLTGGTGSFARGLREGAISTSGAGSSVSGSQGATPAPATADTSTTPASAAAAPALQEDPTSKALGETVSAPFRALGRGVAAVGRGALDVAGRVGQGMAQGAGQGLAVPAPTYLPSAVGGVSQAPQPRSAIGTPPMGTAGVPGQPGAQSGPQAAAPPGAAPGLGQQQSPSLGMQIFNAINNSAQGF